MTLAHHTQDKGDKGMALVIAALTIRGIKIALPISEHLPFDLIAICNDGTLSKVSVKYRAARDGKIEVSLRSQWAGAKSSRQRVWSPGDVDSHAIYCPDTNQCYFVRDDEVVGHTITLRINTPRRKAATVRRASDYEDPERIFQ